MLQAGFFFNDPAILSWWMEISITESVWLAAIHFPFSAENGDGKLKKRKTNIVLDYNLFQPPNFLAGILPLDKFKNRSKVQRSNRKCGGHRPWRRCFRKCCRTGREKLWKTANQLSRNRGNTEQRLTNILLILTSESQVCSNYCTLSDVCGAFYVQGGDSIAYCKDPIVSVEMCST